MMANRLHESTSPYLLQHADNPVDWFEWGNEAFSEAIRRDVPVLLSVGYSACHWCHVMAHESFEDGPTAAEMNRLFVNVKVDREERPDVDAIYMEAVQSMTGHGGWPMTVWLTPEGHPFFAGTYFPSRDRGGLPSFRRVLAGVSQAWQERRGDVAAQAGRISETLAAELPMGDSLPSADSIEAAYRALASAYDPTFGGFGSAPKFPQQPVLEFLLRLTSHTRNTGAASMLGQTLEYMAAGGIHDQLGGGFARYAVDQGWQIPHFEKMLYDNAQLARLFLWAGVELDRPDLVDVARTTLDYLLADLRHPDGGFFSAEDADSEGVEGKFYTWTHVEFNEVAGADAAVARAAWGVTPAGNFDGASVLHRALRPTEVATLLQSSPEVVSAGLDRARRRLLQRRNTRVRPGLDDKVVAGWNGLAIRALAEAGAALDEPRYLEAAGKAAHFVLNRMSTAGGGLARTWAKGRAGRVSAFLEDYAAIGIGLLSLFAATGEVSWFQHAEGIVRQLPDRFGSDGGGMYSSENSDLIKRPKDLFDNPAPSGNSLAAEAMLLLSLYTGDLDLRAVAEANLMAVAPLIDRYPTAAGHALAVIVSLHRGTKELAVVGPEATALSRVYWRRYRPNVVLAMAAADTPQVPLLTDRARPGQTLAYVCAGLFCLAPTDSAATLVASLDNS